MTGSLKIALADSNSKDLAILIQALAEQRHHVISTSRNGRELVEQCRIERPDLVITGIKMPHMDGIHASIEICRDKPLPIIFVSAFHDSNLIARALDDHVLAFLVKPIKRADLETSIALVMRRFADFQALRRQADELRADLNRIKKLDRLRISIAELENQSKTATVPKDASERERAKKHQKATEDRHRSLLETIPHGVQQIDTTGTITFSNSACCQLHGYQPGELQGKTIWHLLASNVEQQQFREALQRRIALQPAPASYTTRHLTKDGRVIDVQIDWTYMRDDQGEVAGFTSIVTDVSERKRTEEALQEARDQLELKAEEHSEKLAKADQTLQYEISRRKKMEQALRRSERLTSIGILAAGIAHEINNPLVAALNSAETALAVKEKPNSDEMIQECLENVVDSAKRCGEIITNVLRFASHEHTQKCRNCLNDVVRHGLRLAGEILGPSASEFEFKPASDRLEVLVNPLEIQVVLANLLQNAVQAKRGNAPVHIDIKTFQRSDHACIEVTDDGCGITEEDMDHIFDPFFTTRKEVGGTGLGLSIVYSIVREHGGTVDVQSKFGNGTAITIKLPYADSQILAEFD